MRRPAGLVSTFALAASLLHAGCATSPTGRRQVQFLPDGQMSSMGAQAFEQIKGEKPIERDPAWNAYVKCVAMPVADMAKGQTGVESWEIVVFRDESANAFALPGGKIGVHTGILKVAKTDGQLAAVLGHEVGHVIAKHGNERVSQAMIAQGGLILTQAATRDSQWQGILLGLAGAGAQVGLLKYGRDQETESDLVGLDLMSRAGFDPRESIELWRNMMSASGGGGPPEWLSTHPKSENRISNLRENLPPAMEKYRRAQAEGRAPVCRRP